MSLLSPTRVALVLGALLLVTTTSYFFFIPESLLQGDHGLHAAEGPYGAHDAEFNWCEPDYASSVYIAELWNTLTSALYIVAAWLAYYLHWPVLRFFPLLQATMLATALTGLGSMLFHASLVYKMQLADELPLYGLILSASLSLYTRGESPRRASDNIGRMALVWWSLISILLLFLPRAHVVHTVFRGVMTCTFSAMFLYVFWAGAAASNECRQALEHTQSHQDKHKNKQETQRTATRPLRADNVGCFFQWGFLLILGGVVCWILDNFFCALLRALPVYPQLHAFGWHLGTAMGLWCTYQMILVHSVLFCGDSIRSKDGGDPAHMIHLQLADVWLPTVLVTVEERSPTASKKHQ